MKNVRMYSTHICPYCLRSEMLLKSRGVVNLEKILVDRDPDRLHEMVERTGCRTVPQIFIGEHHIGGFDDLAALDRKGELVPILGDAA